MKVNSVFYGTGAIHASKSGNEFALSEFAYLPKQTNPKLQISENGFKKILVGLAAIAVAVTLSKLKMPFDKHQMDLINILC